MTKYCPTEEHTPSLRAVPTWPDAGATKLSGTMVGNTASPVRAELGIVASQGISRVGDLVAVLMSEEAAERPTLARRVLRGLAAESEA